MKRQIALLLMITLIVSLMPVTALAAGASIQMGGKVGFMYADMSVTLRPKLKNLLSASLKWSSSDISVAEVEGGTIRSRAPGRTVITASAGGVSARCGVVVLPRSVQLRAGETYSLPYGTVEEYAVKDKSIALISKRGVIYGRKAGSTVVGVRYGRQTLFVQVEVIGADEDRPLQSEAANLDCAVLTDQIVLVDHTGGSKATLSIHEKRSGVWTQIYSCTAYVGKNGVGKTREGDKKTPSGTYNLTMPFGIKADPGANSEYTQVTKYHYWCGTSGSEYYNQLVDMREVNRHCVSSDEYLLDYKGVYNYCMFIDYNAAGEAGKGSCIFLHCTGSNNYTAGCIAVPEAVMKKIVQWAQPGAKIVIR